MTTLSYIMYGNQGMQIKFACAEDATDAARALINVPGVVNITVREDGCKPYCIQRKSRYMLHYTHDKDTWKRTKFASITDATLWGEHNAIDYKIVDLLTNETFYPEDVECLV